MNDHQPRPRAPSVPPGTLALLRAAVAASLSPGPDTEIGELFRAARNAARRDAVPPADLVEVIVSTWDELADAAGIPPASRSDRLADVLSRCLEAITEPDREAGRQSL